ncbi:MAG TPA: hypothetical protein VN428_02730 [Bryobacteraceae bacterium]|nr:hypothetical protein [Bryobacteraceae bacterium]
MRAATRANTEPASIRIVTKRNGVTVQTLMSLSVKAIAPVIPRNDSAPAVPLTPLNKWKDTYKKLGTKWCKANEGMLWGWEGQVWYYDGGRVYVQMADYFRDPSWEPCAYNILGQYRDTLLAQKSWNSGWRVFTKGLRMPYERTGDPRYKDALHVLATKSPYAATGGDVRDTFMRETAFILQAYVDDELAGNGRNPNLERSVAFLLGHFEAVFETGDFLFHQTFMDGLAAEALIDYYELTGDPRIPAAIRSMLDWMWENGWDPATNRLVYNPEPEGDRCSANNGCQVYKTELINLIVPAFAWYWRLSGDAVYARRGDILFSHSLDTDISYSGKIFSQNYRWSPSYVQWRAE